MGGGESSHTDTWERPSIVAQSFTVVTAGTSASLCAGAVLPPYAAFVSQSGDLNCQLRVTSLHLLCCFCLYTRQPATERKLLTPPQAPTST